MIALEAGSDNRADRQPVAMPWYGSRRLWSLWDMLRVSASNYLTLGASLEDIVQILVKSEDITESPYGKPLTDNEIDKLTDTLRIALDECKKLHLPVSVSLLETRTKYLPSSSGALDVLVDAIHAELGANLFLFVPPHVARYYERDDLVSEKVTENFPKSSEEIRTAGTCLAAGLNTACVFHAMRAAEIGVRALGEDLKIIIKSGKPMELAEWREILDGVNGAIQKIENLPNSTPNKDEDLHFYSEACAQFRFFKNGWRIRVAHARANYTEPQAKEALDHVASFFETLSSRLWEPL